jgi:gamma-glutamylcyclotransferase (GGCT)/AIG2-like uncharacterized protein YtfP
MPLLFSYGTLQLPDVQRALFGRLVPGRADALVGYVLDDIAIGDPAVVGLSGVEVHRIARATGDPDDRVPGLVLELDATQLAAADAYETDAYTRIEVTLASGTRAFLYARADTGRAIP